MKVLLVDDEPQLVEALARGLRQRRFDVDVALTGPDGLERARSREYDVVVLDILLPGLNGYRVCRTLRAEGIGTPVLMLTAKQGAYDEVDALEEGADDYLRKPFAFPVLVARIEALARRTGTATPRRLRVGSLELDPESRECRRGDEEIELTPREFEMLLALMRRPGRVIRSEDLLSEVWGDDFSGDPNIVHVYANYLRNKIDRPFGCRSLVNRRGVGFLLRAEKPATTDEEG